MAAGRLANLRLRRERRAGERPRPRDLADARARMDEVSDASRNLVQAERDLLAERTGRQRRSIRLTRAALRLLLLLALVGFVLAILTLLRDLARMAATEQRLAESHERVRAIIEGSHDLIVALDGSGRVLAANAALRERVRELYGKEVEDGGEYLPIFAANPAVHERLRALWARSLSGEDFETLVASMSGGEARQYELRFAAMRSASGRILGSAMTARDVTSRLEAEAALRHQKEELARSNEELERFAYVASHDLKEPLRMVVSYTQLLERRYKGKLDADADEFIRFAVDGAMRMHAMIDGLLEFSRAGPGDAALRPEDAERSCALALANLQSAIAEAGAEVTRERLPVVLTRGGQLHRVFQNLAANALKFRSRDRRPVLRFSARREGGEWTFSVADNGIGIPPEHLRDVFALFKRLHTRKEYPGTGLGLAICKKIVEGHGGRIWVESKLGEGSTFHFTAKAAEAADQKAL